MATGEWAVVVGRGVWWLTNGAEVFSVAQNYSCPNLNEEMHFI